jgi:hypothetical protein
MQKSRTCGGALSLRNAYGSGDREGPNCCSVIEERQRTVIAPSAHRVSHLRKRQQDSKTAGRTQRHRRRNAHRITYVGLVEEVRKVLGAAEKLKGPAGNEANTKALLIEPVLAALDWDVTDVDHVVREWRVFDNTALGYALKIDDTPALYVEAKGVNRNLEDKQFILSFVIFPWVEGGEAALGPGPSSRA